MRQLPHVDRSLGVAPRRESLQSEESPTSAFLEMIIRRPQEVATSVAQAVETGADPGAVLALLDAAEGLSQARGVKVAPFIAAMRQRLSPSVLQTTAPP
jgi:hypothetical protein